jgi:DNA polymerase III epsilon subunit
MNDTVIVLDLETTGLYPENGDMILEIAAIPVEDKDIRTDMAFHEMVNPEKRIPPEITKINHITDKMVVNAKPIREVLPDFIDYIKDYPLVAHNAPFDTGFLKYFSAQLGLTMRNNRLIDTIDLSKKLFRNERHHNLDAVLKRLDIAIDSNERHSAQKDAYFTSLAYIKMRAMLNTRY